MSVEKRAQIALIAILSYFGNNRLDSFYVFSYGKK